MERCEPAEYVRLTSEYLSPKRLGNVTYFETDQWPDQFGPFGNEYSYTGYGEQRGEYRGIPWGVGRANKEKDEE